MQAAIMVTVDSVTSQMKSSTARSVWWWVLGNCFHLHPHFIYMGLVRGTRSLTYRCRLRRGWEGIRILRLRRRRLCFEMNRGFIRIF